MVRSTNINNKRNYIKSKKNNEIEQKIENVTKKY